MFFLGVTLMGAAVWVACVYGGALIFGSKNRQPGLGALLGALLGVAGLVVAAFFSKRVGEEGTAPEGDVRRIM